MREEILLALVTIAARINGVIRSFESIGLQVADDAFDGNLYGALDSTINAITIFTGIGSVEYFSIAYSDTYQHLINVDEDTIDPVYLLLMHLKEENK